MIGWGRTKHANIGVTENSILIPLHLRILTIGSPGAVIAVSSLSLLTCTMGLSIHLTGEAQGVYERIHTKCLAACPARGHLTILFLLKVIINMVKIVAKPHV